MIVFGLGKKLLFKSILGHCARPVDFFLQVNLDLRYPMHFSFIESSHIWFKKLFFLSLFFLQRKAKFWSFLEFLNVFLLFNITSVLWSFLCFMLFLNFLNIQGVLALCCFGLRGILVAEHVKICSIFSKVKSFHF